MSYGDIGKTIRRLRDEKKWSQITLAEKAGISNVYLSQVENGKQFPQFRVLDKISKALGISTTSLLDSNEDTELDYADERDELLEWANEEKNRPYVEFAYKLSKEIPVELLDKLKSILNIYPGRSSGGSSDE